MTKQEFLHTLHQESVKLVFLQEKCKHFLSSYSTEELIVKNNKYFYLSILGTRKRKYLSGNNTETIKALAQKRYYENLTTASHENQKVFDKCIKVLETHTLQSIEEVFDSLPDVIKPYVTPLEETNEGYARYWQNTKYVTKNIDQNSPYITLRKEIVRSKSEVLIADRLYNAGIPYHYEKPHRIGKNQTWYPDFSILNKRTRTEFIWEHFGLVENPDYCSQMIMKLEEYSKNGYFIGKNLITTYESSQHSLSTEYIDRIIKEFLK